MTLAPLKSFSSSCAKSVYVSLIYMRYAIAIITGLQDATTTHTIVCAFMHGHKLLALKPRADFRVSSLTGIVYHSYKYYALTVAYPETGAGVIAGRWLFH